MNGKTKFLIVGLLLLATLSFFLGHFWSYTVWLLQKAVVVEIVPSFVFAKFIAGITGMSFLL